MLPDRRYFPILMSSRILSSHCISFHSNLLLSNFRKQGLMLKHRSFFVSNSGKTDAFDVHPSRHVGCLLIFSMSVTLERLTLLGNSCS